MSSSPLDPIVEVAVWLRKIVKWKMSPARDYSYLKSQAVQSGATEMVLEGDKTSSFPFSDRDGRQRLRG